MRRFFVGLAILAVAVQIPIGASADDGQIAQQIVKQLRLEKQKGNLRGFGLDLKVEDGEVLLSGTVASSEQEQLAIDTARSVDGVTMVIEDIEVTAPEKTGKLGGLMAKFTGNDPSKVTPVSYEATDEGSAKSSRQIAEEIVGQLREEKSAGKLKGFGIDVEVDKGIVWLKGSVSTQKQEQLAVDIARHTQGVRKVVNALAVTSTESGAIGEGVEHAFRDFEEKSTTTLAASQSPRTDSTKIAQDVVRQLQAKKKDGSLRDFGIDVQVDEGELWLSGYVADASQQTLVLDIARYTPGVTKVINDLTISDQSLLEPTQLAAATSPIGSSGQPADLSAQSGMPYYGYPVPTRHMQAQAQAYARQNQTPLPFAQARPASHMMQANMQSMQSPQPTPIPMNGGGYGIAPARYDHPQMPGYAWPSYSAYPNYGAVTYPQQYSPSAWPYIGPFYPYPQVPLGWRKVALEWDDGWWHLKFNSKLTH